jgi:ElaB/YqjD/DUF883 family membrane-anchored ribosome-binding protein
MAANRGNQAGKTGNGAPSGGGASGTSTGGRAGKLVDGVQDRFREASEDVRHGAERASDEIRRGYERASQAAREGYVRVEKDLQGLSRDVNTYVRDNPGKSVVLAAAAGFLLGFLMRSEED